MSALTKAYETFEKPGLLIAYRLAATAIFKGALVGVDSSGYLVPMDHDVASLKFVGIAADTIDNSAGSPGDRSVNVSKSGSFVFKAATGYAPSQADIGKEAYANTDWEVQAASAGLTTAYKVGRIVALETTSTGAAGVRIRLDGYGG